MAIAVFWVLFALAAISSLRWSVYLFAASMAFGAFNVVPGSISVVPQMVCAPLMLVKVMTTIGRLRGHAVADALLNWRRLGFLTGFVAVAVVVTLIAPWVFHGAPTIGLDTAADAPLRFGTTNATQTVYLLVSATVAVSSYTLMLEDSGRRILVQALLIAGATQVAAGIVEMAFAGSNGLAVVRTATYTILADNEFADIGMRRVIGFYTEASAYGASTLGLATLLLVARPARLLSAGWELAEAMLGIVLAIFTFLSTSSAAYIGLAVLLAVVVTSILARAVGATSLADRRRNRWELAGMFVVGASAAIYLMWNPQIIAQLWRVIDTIVLQKQGTSSFTERDRWNQISLHGLASTWGFGLGVGSTRTSSWPVALLACTGVGGSLLMAMFLLRCVVACSAGGDNALAGVARATRPALLVMLVPGLGTAASVDFGTVFGMLFGMMASLPLLANPPEWLAGQSASRAPSARPKPRRSPPAPPTPLAERRRPNESTRTTAERVSPGLA